MSGFIPLMIGGGAQGGGAGGGGGGVLTVTLSTTSLFQDTSTQTNQTTKTCAASVSGNTSPATSLIYAWTVECLSPATVGSVYAVSPNTSATAFRASYMETGEVRTARAYCTVTDPGSGQTARSGYCNIHIERADLIDYGTR